MKKLLLFLLLTLSLSAFADNDVSEWSTTDASNNSAAPDGFPEGMAPGDVNDSARAVMGEIAEWYQDMRCTITTGGSSNAYTLTTNVVYANNNDPSFICFSANHTNTGAATMTLDGNSTQDLERFDRQDLAAGDIQMGEEYIMIQDGGAFLILNPSSLEPTDFGNSLIPAADDTHDLGSASNEWRNLYIDGTAAIDVLDLPDDALQVADIGAGALPSDVTVNDDNWSGTDLAAGNGGTGASTLTDGGVLLGSGTGAITAMSALSDGEIIVGDGTTDPVAESGATLRTSIGVGTGDSPQFTGIELGDASDTTIARSGAGAITVEGVAVPTISSSSTFTNKTFDANGTGNSLSNVDVADLADGTDGELITWDSDGSAATVGAGSSGQVLTSNGAGAAPTFQAAAGGGIVTGTYTGDGSTSQGITGLGCSPDLVWTIPESSDGSQISAVWTTDTYVDNDAQGMAVVEASGTGKEGAEDNLIVSLDADGFTVDDNGSDLDPNKASQSYSYFAICP